MPENNTGIIETRPTTTQSLPNRAEQDWYNRSHEELVGAFQGYIREQQRLFNGTVTPEKIIKMRLASEANSPVKGKSDLFRDLNLAWNVLAYDRYEPGTPDEREAGWQTSWFFGEEPDKTIKLADPQSHILGALTQAVGIPYDKERTEIAIPENLRHYDEWVFTDEYKQRVVEAQRKRGNQH